jgi:4-hydroxybenzoate polyprenyltransferase
MMRDMPSSAAGTPRTLGERVLDSYPVALLRAGHQKVAVGTTTAVAASAALAGRGTREVLLVAVTVFVGQLLLGWRNDLRDRDRDARHDRDKPLVEGALDPGDLWFASGVGFLLVVPLSVANGVVAGLSHLALLLIAWLGLFRVSALSPLPWAASYALWPAFLSYGGWGGGWDGAEGSAPPTIAITLLAALLGVGVHFLLALPGLVDDNKDGLRHLPLRIALKTGASRLLLFTAAYLGVVLIALLVVAGNVGLRQ